MLRNLQSSAPILLSARTTTQSSLLFTADLWLLNATTAAPCQRGIPMPSEGGWFIPDGVGDSRPGQGGSVTAYNPTFTHPYLSSRLSGVKVRVDTAAWTVRGKPIAELATAMASQGTVLTEHVLNFRTVGTSLYVSQGLLYPGYVYSASATFKLSASLAGRLATGAPFPAALPSGISAAWYSIAAPAATLLGASAYVHLPPAQASLGFTVSPRTETRALIDRLAFTGQVGGDAARVDASARSVSQPAVDTAAALLIASNPALPNVTLRLLALSAAEPSNANGKAAAELADAAGKRTPSQCLGQGPVAGQWASVPAWQLVTQAQGQALNRTYSVTCFSTEAAAAAAAAAANAANATVVPVSPSDLSVYYHAVLQTNSSGAVQAAARALNAYIPMNRSTVALAQVAATSPTTWLGQPLTSAPSFNASGIVLPFAVGGYDVSVLMYVRDSEGSVAAVVQTVTQTKPPDFLAALSGSGSSSGSGSGGGGRGGNVSASTARDVTNYVKEASAAIPPPATNPAGALTSVSSMGALLSAGSSGNLAAGALNSSALADLQESNKALKAQLLGTVGSAITSLAGSFASFLPTSPSSGGGGSKSTKAALASANFSDAERLTLSEGAWLW